MVAPLRVAGHLAVASAATLVALGQGQQQPARDPATHLRDTLDAWNDARKNKAFSATPFHLTTAADAGGLRAPSAVFSSELGGSAEPTPEQADRASSAGHRWAQRSQHLLHTRSKGGDVGPCERVCVLQALREEGYVVDDDRVDQFMLEQLDHDVAAKQRDVNQWQPRGGGACVRTSRKGLNHAKRMNETTAAASDAGATGGKADAPAPAPLFPKGAAVRVEGLVVHAHLNGRTGTVQRVVVDDSRRDLRDVLIDGRKTRLAVAKLRSTAVSEAHTCTHMP